MWETNLYPCSKGLSPNPGQSVKKGKMGGNTELVLKPGIKFRSASGSLRRPQVAPDSPRLFCD